MRRQFASTVIGSTGRALSQTLDSNTTGRAAMSRPVLLEGNTMADKPKTVTAKTTRIVDGTLFSKGGTYTVDKTVEARLKETGVIGGKKAAPAAADEAVDAEKTEATDE